MKLSMFARLAFAVSLGLALVADTGHLRAQPQQPSPTSIALAKEIITLKGGFAMFDPVVAGVVESVKNSLLPTNLNLAKDLNEVSLKISKELEPKHAELINLVARTYAKHFTEQELKQLDAFYKTPLGRKVIAEEAKALDESLKEAQSFAGNLSEQVMSMMRKEMKKRGHDL